jgi:hypothetical protein
MAIPDTGSPKMLSLTVYFTETSDVTEDKKEKFLTKIRELIEKDKELLPVKNIENEKNSIFLSTPEFNIRLGVKNLAAIQIIVDESMDKNQPRLNELTNRIVNYFNTVLGDSAKNAKISCMYIDPENKGQNITAHFIEESKLVKLNEAFKNNIIPKGIVFDFNFGKHRNTIFYINEKEKSFLTIMAHSTYDEETVPWDLVNLEYENLRRIHEMLGKIAQEEI